MRKLLVTFICIAVMTLTSVTVCMAEEPEEYITRLYRVCLNRTEEQIARDAGVNQWVSDIDSSKLSVSEATYGVIFSAEFQKKNYSNEEYISKLYEGILGRRADKAGYDYWLQRLYAGSSRKDVMDGFINSAEFKKTHDYISEINYTQAVYTPAYFKQMGVLHWGGHTWTWYTQRILPGYGLWIPGRHLDENGYVCDENDYICLASNLSYLPRYTVVETPFGKLGQIYDTGCGYGVLDVYTNW